MTTNQLFTLALAAFLTLLALGGYLGLWLACRDRKQQVKRPTGTSELW
jgi:hypothetical protein